MDARSATSAGEFGTCWYQKNEPLGGGVGLAIVGNSYADEIASLSMPNCHAYVRCPVLINQSAVFHRCGPPARRVDLPGGIRA